MLSITGRVLLEGTQDVHLPENASVFLTDVSLEALAFDPAQNIFRARLVQNGRIVNETKYFFAPFEEMTAHDAEVDVQTRQISGNQYEVTLTANRFVWMAHLCEPDGTIYSNNDMDLWPGEPCRIIATTDDPHYTPLLVWMGKENDT
jgi:hypothetical protein